MVTARILPGWTVTGTSSTKGDVVGRVVMAGIEGGVLLDLNDGRIAGFNADESRELIVVQETDSPYEVSDHGDLWLTGWTHIVGARAPVAPAP